MSQSPFPYLPSDRHEAAGQVPMYGQPLVAPAGPGVGGFIAALLAGVPVALLMVAVVLGALVDGNAPGLLVSILGASSVAGSVLAIIGLCSRPRRFRTLALVLTIIPALVVAMIVGALVAFIGLVG